MAIRRLGFILIIVGICVLASTIVSAKSYGEGGEIELDPSFNSALVSIQHMDAATYKVVITRIKSENMSKSTLCFLLLEADQLELWATNKKSHALVNVTVQFDDEVEKSFKFILHRPGIYAYVVENIGNSTFHGFLTVKIEKIDTNMMYKESPILITGVIILVIDLVTRQKSRPIESHIDRS